MKAIIVFGLLISTVASAQSDSLWRHGNNTFRLTVKSLQSYFTKPFSIGQFEKTLGNYNKMWYSVDTTRYKDGDIKVTIPYGIMNKDTTIDIIYVDYDGKTNKLIEIRFAIEERHVRIDAIGNFMKQMATAGYEYDLVSNRIYSRFGDQRIYYYHKTNKVLIGINPTNEYKTFVLIRKR